MTRATTSRSRIGCVHRIRHFPYWATLAQGIQTRAAECGVDLCLAADDADDAWEGPVAEVVQQRPQVVILPHSLVEAFPEAMRPFQEARIPIVGVEMAPDPRAACVIRADEAQGAEVAVARLFELLGGVGGVVNISAGGPTLRQAAIHALLPRYPAIELALDLRGDWSRASGASAMRAALDQRPDVRGVFAHNDHMALGACDAIRERGLAGRIVVVGFDADPEGLIAVRDGELAATVYRGLYGIGRGAVDAALRVSRGEEPRSEIRVPTTLITRENLVDATLDTTLMLPSLLHDMLASSRSQRSLQQEIINAQRHLIRELSTPILPISDTILVMPLIGAIDSARAEQVMTTMLEAIALHGARHLIIDITGIAVVDTAVAQHIMQAAQAVQLLGAQAILVGISPEVAQTLVSLGVSFRTLVTCSTLRAGVEYARGHTR